MDNTPEYWDKEWDKRIQKDGSVRGNMQKAEIILQEIWSRPYLFKSRKLDIGCGPATHVRKICEIAPDFGRDYIGIDTSQRAVDEVESAGLVAFRESIHSFEISLGFDAFFLFDVLEHIENHTSVAMKIKELGAKEYCILVNIPLYLSEPEGGYERLVNIRDMSEFFNQAGCTKFSNRIYGINGYPYMFLEGVTA